MGKIRPKSEKLFVHIKMATFLISTDSYGVLLLSLNIEDLYTHKDLIVLFQIRHCKMLFTLKNIF